MKTPIIKKQETQKEGPGRGWWGASKGGTHVKGSMGGRRTRREREKSALYRRVGSPNRSSYK